MSMYYIGSVPFGQSDIQHFGVKGMKWGVRRYRNEDGTLTAMGKARYEKAQKDVSKYKSFGERLARTTAGGLVGGALSLAADVVIATSATKVGAAIVSSAAAAGAGGALLGLSATALVQGAHALRTYRGAKFIDTYRDAYNRTKKKER